MPPNCIKVAEPGSMFRASHPGASACRLDREGCGYNWSSEPTEGLAPGHFKLERRPSLQTWTRPDRRRSGVGGFRKPCRRAKGLPSDQIKSRFPYVFPDSQKHKLARGII